MIVTCERSDSDLGCKKTLLFCRARVRRAGQRSGPLTFPLTYLFYVEKVLEISTKESTQIQRLFLEDLQVGDHWVSDEREITAEDVADFALLTGDHDPLHEDGGMASPFGEPVAHGLLGLSVLAGLSSSRPDVATLALVAISDWHFESPVFFGDIVCVRTEVLDVQPHGRRAGRVTWNRDLINQHGRVVQRGRFVTLVAARSRMRRDAKHETVSPRSLPPR